MAEKIVFNFCHRDIIVLSDIGKKADPTYKAYKFNVKYFRVLLDKQMVCNACKFSYFTVSLFLGGGDYLEILHVPGHTKGSIVIYYPQQQILFTGN